MASLDKIIERFGFGRFGISVLVTSASLWIVSGAEITLIMILSSQLKCEWRLSYAQTILLSNTIFIGMAIGSLLMGWIADKTGRKRVTIALISTLLYFGVLCAKAPTYFWFVILRTFAGIGVAAEMTGPFYLVEFLGRKYRAKTIVLNSLFFATGNIYALLLAYFILPSHGWRVYILCVLIPVPFIILLITWLPESIRYLQNTDKYDELMKTLMRISEMNRIPLPKQIEVLARPSTRRGSIRVLRKYHCLTLVQSILLFVAAKVNLYGILILSTEVFSVQLEVGENLLENEACTYIHGDDFLRSVIVSLGAIIGSLIMCLFVDIIGRKACIIFSFFVSICFFIPLAFNMAMPFMIGLLFVSRTFADPLIHLAWVFIAENHPTVIRGTVLGAATFFGNIAVLIAPVLVQWIFHLSQVSTAVSFIFVSCVGILCTIFMPAG